VKRWAALLALFLVAAIGAVAISTRMQPSDLERRHATIRVGMTYQEVERIMETPPMGGFNADDGEKRIWWRRSGFAARNVDVAVTFDREGRVVRMTVDGKQRQP
jgi:hypothetical protein